MIPKYPTPHQFRAAPLPTTIRIEHDQQSLSRCRGCRAGRHRAWKMIYPCRLPSWFAYAFAPSLSPPHNPQANTALPSASHTHPIIAPARHVHAVALVRSARASPVCGVCGYINPFPACASSVLFLTIDIF
jgi:hypothetical protein